MRSTPGDKVPHRPKFKQPAASLPTHYAVGSTHEVFGFVNFARRLAGLVLCAAVLVCGGCPDPAGSTTGRLDGATLEPIYLDDPLSPIAAPVPLELAAARNEWTSFTLSLHRWESSPDALLQVGELRGPNGASIKASELQLFQVASVPAEVTCSYVRQTGQAAPSRSLARVLVPIEMRTGATALSAAGQPAATLWFDLHVPQDAVAGQYHGQVAIVRRGRTVAAVPLRLTVYDFELPSRPHLQLVGALSWEQIVQRFGVAGMEAIPPSLLNRRDPRFASQVGLLDQLMQLSHEHRTSLTIGGLGPTVKWPAGLAPQIDFADFDSLLGPWMDGGLFADDVALPLWPMPPAANLDQFDSVSRMQYWAQSAAHFQQLGWIDRMPIQVLGGTDSSDLAATSQLLASIDNAAVWLWRPQAQLPQVLSSGPWASRVWAMANSAIGHADAQPNLPARWLSAASVVSSCAKNDLQLCAWLAYLRHVELAYFDSVGSTLATSNEPARPDQMVWFSPGQPYGRSAPLPTVQLKWARQAEQDYEYLWLAAQEGLGAQDLARLIVRPLELPEPRRADPVDLLTTGTHDRLAWDSARDLLARMIELNQPGRTPSAAQKQALDLQLMQWMEPQQRPTVLPRRAQWTCRIADDARSAAPATNVHLQLTADLYSGQRPVSDGSRLLWGEAPNSQWQLNRVVQLSPIPSGQIETASLAADFNLGALAADSTQPLQIRFLDGYHNKVTGSAEVVVPVAACDRRETAPGLDGRLSDWSESQAIADGPLVLMLSRADLQAQRVRRASAATKLYSGWDNDNLYVAFSLEGLGPVSGSGRNFVVYDARRACGEDLCELLVQPVFSDQSSGPLLHAICKPGGAIWVEQADANRQDSSWQPIAGALRYASDVSDPGHWTGEVAIPLRLLQTPGHSRPILLRFNFCQFRQSNCESASWCGPVDFGRDRQLTGALVLRTLTGAAQ